MIFCSICAVASLISVSVYQPHGCTPFKLLPRLSSLGILSFISRFSFVSGDVSSLLGLSSILSFSSLLPSPS